MYKPEDQKRFVDYCARKYVEMLSMPVSSVGTTDEFIRESRRVWGFMIGHSYLLKQFEHSIEDEFRIILFFQDEEDVASYRTQNGIVVPYVKMSQIDGLLPLSEVTIGPKIDDSIAEAGLRHLLREKYEKLKVRKSRIQLRF